MPARLEDEHDDEPKDDEQEQEDALPPPGVLLVPACPASASRTSMYPHGQSSHTLVTSERPPDAEERERRG